MQEPSKAVHRVLGIDPSLSSTGYAYYQGDKLVTGTITAGDLKESWRLYYIRLMLEKLIVVARPTLIVYEGYALGAGGRMNNNVFKLGELGGVLKTFIWEQGIDYVEIPPTVMKSVIALNGRTDKQGIALALKVRFGITVNQNDEADAVGLMLIGEMKCGTRKVEAEGGKSNRFDSVRQCAVVRGKLQLISNPR